MKIQYGSYTFPVDTDKDVFEWTQSISPTLDATGVNRISDKISWKITGTIQGSSLTDINTKLNNFLTAFGSDAQDIKLLDDSNVMQQQMLAADSTNGGPHVESYDAPSTGLEGLYTTNFQFNVTVSTEEISEDNEDPDVIEDTFTITIGIDQDNVITHSKRGKITTKAGASAKDKAYIAISTSVFNPSITPVKVRTNDEVTYNDTDTEANYSIVYKKLWIALPTNVTSGQTSTSTSYNDGLKETTITGNYTGSGALAAVNAKRPSGKKLTTDTVKHNPDDNSYDFTFAYTEASSGGNLIASNESVSITTKRNFKDHKIKRTGVQDYRQIVGNPDYTVKENGEIRGKTSFPTPPSRLLPFTDMESEDIDRSFKRGARNEITEYVTRYTRSYKVLTSPNVRPRT